MAEEQRCQERHRLCANNCGFFGSPATLNLCSKCYRDLRLKEQQASSAKMAVEKSLSPPPSTPASPSTSSSSSSSSSSPPAIASVEKEVFSCIDASGPVKWADAEAPPPKEQQQVRSRCSTCRKRVGLTGFPCRCGATFCGVHRYPERHVCEFNYKAAGREALARANPVVKAQKLSDKI